MVRSPDHERFARLERLFEEAVELPRAEQERFVREQCGDDPKLRRQLEALLASHVSTAHLEGGIAGAAGEVVRVGLAELRPPAIPGFTIRGVLGVGGMGVVYDAEQESPHRAVALKVMSAVVSESARQRFELESELLARLDHPNIARVFSAGRTDSGQPYFALERIDGPRLDLWLDESRDLRERIRLLCRLCEAVEHAHQRGIIHCDLKPSNVLVARDGSPKIVDFGVSKSLDPDRAAARGVERQELAGTLPYMSPEQLRGETAAIDTRTDIYALGVLAYELFSGRLPYTVTGRTVTEAVAALLASELRPLRDAGRHLAGDLDAIVAKAIARDREARYPTATALRQDFERHLAGEPVSVRASSRLYVLSRTLRRHRGFAAGLGVAIAALSTGLVVTRAALSRSRAAEQQASRALAASQRAEREAADARRIEHGLRLCDLAHRFAIDDPGLAGLCALEAASIAPPEALVSAAARVVANLREVVMIPVGRDNVRVTSLAVAADGARAVAGCDEGTVVLLDLESGNTIATVGAHRRRVTHLECDAEGFWSTGEDGVVRAWRIAGAAIEADGNCVMPGVVTSLLVDDDGALVCAGGQVTRISRGGAARVVPRDTPQVGPYVALVAGGTHAIARRGGAHAVVRLADGAVVAEVEGSVLAVDIASGAVLHGQPYRPSLHELGSGKSAQLASSRVPVRWGALDPEGRWVAFANQDGEVHVRERAAPEVAVFSLRGHRGVVNSLRFVAGGRLVTGSQDGTVRVWRMEPELPMTTLRAAPESGRSRRSSPGFDATGARLVVCEPDGSARVVATDSGESLAELRADGALVTACFRRANEVVALTEDGALVAFELGGDPRPRTLLSLEGAYSFAAHPGTGRVALCAPGLGVVHDVDGREVGRFVFDGATPWVSFSPDGLHVQVVTQDRPNQNYGRVFTAEGAPRCETFECSTTTEGVRTFGAWSPDGRRFAVCMREKGLRPPVVPRRAMGGAGRRFTLEVLDLGNGDFARVDLGDHEIGLRGVAWSPDGAELAVAVQETKAARGLVLLIDATTLALHGEIAATESAPTSVQYSPDGALLLTCAQRGRVDLRDRSGRLVHHLVDVDGRARGADWSPRGDAVLVSSVNDPVTRLFRLDFVERLRTLVRRPWLPGEREQLGLPPR